MALQFNMFHYRNRFESIPQGANRLFSTALIFPLTSHYQRRGADIVGISVSLAQLWLLFHLSVLQLVTSLAHEHVLMNYVVL